MPIFIAPDLSQSGRELGAARPPASSHDAVALQRKARVVQPVRQLDRLAQELADTFDRSTKLRRRNAKAREEVVESRAILRRTSNAAISASAVLSFTGYVRLSAKSASTRWLVARVRHVAVPCASERVANFGANAGV